MTGEKRPRALQRGIAACLVFFASGRLAAADPPLQPSDVFQPARASVSVSFKEHFTDTKTGTEAPPAEFWVSRGVIGFSFRVTYHFVAPVNQIFLLYPDADPFILRFIVLPEQSLCYKNTFFRKDYPFDPHLISFRVLWHRLIDNLYDMAARKKLEPQGEETVAGYKCKKVGIGPLPETGWMVWYSPELDLVLRTDAYEYGKSVSRIEMTDIKEGRIGSEAFKLPPGCAIKDLSPGEFNALDAVKPERKR